jgi:hypothetical protein
MGRSLLMAASSTSAPLRCRDRRRCLPHALYFAGAAGKVGKHEEPDPGLPVVCRHWGQVLQHQSGFGRAVTGAGTRRPR